MKSTKTISLRFTLIVCALFICGFVPALKAGSITHAILTDHFFRNHPEYTDEEKDSFRSGTLFADIHFITDLEKEDTYFPDVTIEDILNEPSPFVAGMKFHSLVDNLRDDFIAQGDHLTVLSHLKKVKHKDTFLKFLEDEIVYQSLDKAHWQKRANTIHPDELDWGIEQAKLDRWHYLLNLSFTYYPSTLVFMAHLKGKGLLNVPASEVAVWNKTFENTAKKEAVKNYVNELIKMFAEQIK